MVRAVTRKGRDMSSEYRFVTFRQPANALIPPNTGDAKSLTIDLINSDPNVAAQMDGWDVVNTQVVPISGEEILIIFTLTTKVNVPGSNSGEFWGA